MLFCCHALFSKSWLGGRLLLSLLSSCCPLLLPQVLMHNKILFVNKLLDHLTRIEAKLPLSALFQSTNGNPVNCSNGGKSKTSYDEISGAVLLVLRAITQQPLDFWVGKDWIGGGAQHAVEVEVIT